MSLARRPGTPIRYLILSSLVYLALPYLIFAVGWLRWYYALLCVSLIVFALYCLIRTLDHLAGDEQAGPGEAGLGRWAVILAAVVAVLFLGISGVGGFGYQDPDWLKHNAILKGLVERPWPVVYQVRGQSLPLVYYVAYYLPAALAGRLGSWYLANQTLFAWSWIGLCLAMQWFVVLARRSAPAMLLLFVSFSGLDVIGQFVARWVVVPLRPEAAALLSWTHIEQWSIGWQYSSNMTLLFWVPHQALAGWIAAGILLHAVLNCRPKTYALLVVGLTALWSPLVTVGLLPFVLAGFLLDAGSWPSRLRQYVSVPNLCGLAMLVVVGLYYGSKLVPALPSLGGSIPQGFSLSFAADAQARAIGLALIVAFCVLEFGLYGILVAGSRRSWTKQTKGVFVTALVCLSLFPFYRFGGVNDFVMRASIPALFVLAVFVGRALQAGSMPRFRRTVLVVLLVLGSVTALVEVRRHVDGILSAGTLVNTPRVSRVMDIDHWGTSTDKDVTILLQYVGSAQVPFFEYVARPR